MKHLFSARSIHVHERVEQQGHWLHESPDQKEERQDRWGLYCEKVQVVIYVICNRFGTKRKVGSLLLKTKERSNPALHHQMLLLRRITPRLLSPFKRRIYWYSKAGVPEKVWAVVVIPTHPEPGMMTEAMKIL